MNRMFSLLRTEEKLITGWIVAEVHQPNSIHLPIYKFAAGSQSQEECE